MKAILKTDSKVYARQNGCTFEASALTESYVDLVGVNPKFPNNAVSFKLDEVIIVDLEKEIDQANLTYIKKLFNYCEVNKISY